jgi:hypothetical protein
MGDVPTWLAVIVATYGGYVALRQLRQQQKVIKDEIDRNRARDALIDGQLRELADREISRQREQAEAVDVTWEDSEDLPGKSIVVVINDSRRPIRIVTAWVYPEKSGVERIQADYGQEMRPAIVPYSIDAYVLPAQPQFSHPVVFALRARGRAGFQFPVTKNECPYGEARVRFTDDAGYNWELTSGLSLSMVEPRRHVPEQPDRNSGAELLQPRRNRALLGLSLRLKSRR